MDPGSAELSAFRVTDLKQYLFCPRILYYHQCLPDVRPTTFKMEMGTEQGAEERSRERRRSLRPYGLARGERCYDLYLGSRRLGLRGKVDLAIRTDDNPAGQWEAIPVDYKLSQGRTSRHFVMQVAAYGLMLEELWDLPARRGFLYLIPARRAVEIEITAALRQQVEQAVAEMTEIAMREKMPEPPKPNARLKCAICEFRRFCNDV